MSKLCTTLAALAVAATAGSAFANGDVVRTHSLEVKERLQYIERIDVTAEKETSPDAEPLDVELLAILEEVEAIEQRQRTTAER